MSLKNFENWMRERIRKKEDYLEIKKNQYSKYSEISKKTDPVAKLVSETITSISVQLLEDKQILSKYLEETRV